MHVELSEIPHRWAGLTAMNTLGGAAAPKIERSRRNLGVGIGIGVVIGIGVEMPIDRDRDRDPDSDPNSDKRWLQKRNSFIRHRVRHWRVRDCFLNQTWAMSGRD